MSDITKGFILIVIVLLAYILSSNLIANSLHTPDTFQNFLQSYVGKNIGIGGIPSVPFHSIMLAEENKLHILGVRE